MTSLHEIALLRLAAQRIAGAHLPGAAESIGWLTAAQAQDHHGAVTSIALRMGAGDRALVEAAFNAGEIVKSWPMRGTLHLVAARDLPWLVRQCGPRAMARATTRLGALGLGTSTLELARDLTVHALEGGQQRRREELFAAWDEAGLATSGQRGYHILRYLAQTGTVCFGPVHNGEQHLVLVEEWIPDPLTFDGDDALRELTGRYFHGHGPATSEDFSRWSGLTAADVRTGLALAWPMLATLEVDGVAYFMDHRTPERLENCREQARGVFLLPGFDEYLLGYQDRRAVLAAEFADHIVPGGNGVFQPTVVSNGQVVGTWKRTGNRTQRSIVASPFTTFSDEVAEAIPRLYAALP